MVREARARFALEGANLYETSAFQKKPLSTEKKLCIPPPSVIISLVNATTRRRTKEKESKHMSKTTAAKSSVLTADMIAENDTQKQTCWVEFGSVALKFRKLYVPGTPRGTLLGLFRNVEGRAWLAIRTETMPTTHAMTAENEVRIQGKPYVVHVVTDAKAKDADREGALAGVLISEDGSVYRVTRATQYDVEFVAAEAEKTEKK